MADLTANRSTGVVNYVGSIGGYYAGCSAGNTLVSACSSGIVADYGLRGGATGSSISALLSECGTTLYVGDTVVVIVGGAGITVSVWANHRRRVSVMACCTVAGAMVQFSGCVCGG